MQKEIVWADPATKARDAARDRLHPWLLGSKGEVRPLPDKVAAALGANLFYTRLTGHGQDGAAMAEGSVNAWINDYAEAIAIGRAIGDKVVVIGTSTGAALATWAATPAGAVAEVATIVAISPNYGLQAAGTGLLTLPWGREIAELLIGKERSFEPVNALNARALDDAISDQRPAAARRVDEARLRDTGRGDPHPGAVHLLRRRQGGAAGADARDRRPLGRPARAGAGRAQRRPFHHVIAGDALSPATTQVLADRIVAWIKQWRGSGTCPAACRQAPRMRRLSVRRGRAAAARSGAWPRNGLRCRSSDGEAAARMLARLPAS